MAEKRKLRHVPSVHPRRTLIRSLATVATLGVTGCLGGNDHTVDGTKKDSVVIENNGHESRVVSLLVRRDGERLAGGRYRVPENTAVHLERGFEWGTYDVLGKLHRDDEAYEHWQSWTWKPQSCATGDHTNDDGYWIATVRVGESGLRFSHSECPLEVGGPGGGGGNRPVRAGEHRLGNVTDAPGEV